MRLVAYFVDIGGANALLGVDQTLAGGMGATQQVRDEWVHPRCGEEDARIVLREDGGARNNRVTALLEEVQVLGPQFLGGDSVRRSFLSN